MNTAFTSQTYAPAARSFQALRQRPDTALRQRLSRDVRHISYTDRVYARLTLAGRVVAELTRDRIDSYTTLLTLLRSMVPACCRGLARLCVRNMTRGWTLERPLMLYAAPSAPQCPSSPSAPQCPSSPAAPQGPAHSPSRPLMPWDAPYHPH